MGTVLALILILQVRMNPPAAAVNFPDFPDESPAAQAAYEERDLAHRYKRAGARPQRFHGRLQSRPRRFEEGKSRQERPARSGEIRLVQA